MPKAIWELTGNTARLRLTAHDSSATLDLSHVSNGIGDWHLAGRVLTGCRQLGVNLVTDSAAPQIEAYTRQGDLVATFAETPQRPLRVQVYWRADPNTGAIDLQVSVQTDLLDSHPELSTMSVLPVGEVLRLMDTERAEFQPLDWNANIATGTSCLLFRPASTDYSYVEMVHPADCRGDSLSLTEHSRALRLERKLFATFLEKGVILRSRARGLFVPRNDDARLAAEAYAAFLATELPLTT